MHRRGFFLPILFLAVILIPATGLIVGAAGQSTGSNPAPQVSAEQQKQLDQLKQLEAQLDKDRAALHEAILENGVDSDEADAAQAQLSRDRVAYRQLRRSLRSSGVPLPAPSGATSGPGGPSGRYCGMRGAGHHGCGNGSCCCAGDSSGCCGNAGNCCRGAKQ